MFLQNCQTCVYTPRTICLIWTTGLELSHLWQHGKALLVLKVVRYRHEEELQWRLYILTLHLFFFQFCYSAIVSYCYGLPGSPLYYAQIIQDIASENK